MSLERPSLKLPRRLLLRSLVAAPAVLIASEALAATEKWIAGSGQGLSWGSAFGSEVNSLANGNAILSSVSVTNGTALDIFADLSFALGSAAFSAPNFMGVYLYPLNQDGSTYGDGRFASSAAGPPPNNYAIGSIGLVAATQAQEGILEGIRLPPGTFSFVLYNQGGVALASSGNTVKYRTYNRSVQ